MWTRSGSEVKDSVEVNVGLTGPGLDTNIRVTVLDPTFPRMLIGVLRQQ